jgi:hypothetical protein
MCPSSSCRRSTPALALLAAVVGTAVPFDPASDADAAVVCQHRRKPLVRLRVEACKKSEMALLDTAATTSTLGLACVQDPTRRMLMADRDVTALLSLGYVAGTLCRTLDDDLASCALAYEVGLFGATACAAVGSTCLPCYPPLEAEGLCRNACQPPIGCPADPTRTDGREDCGQAATAAECAQSWTPSAEYATPTDVIRATSCFWDAGIVACTACDPGDTALGRCANTCIAAADLPRCRLGGRSYGRCSRLDGKPGPCGRTYELSQLGTQTCWYDAGRGECRGCEPLDESLGRCTNGC